VSLYVVVEGQRTEPRIYQAWLPLMFPGIRAVDRIEEAGNGTFFMISGNGYPSYIDRIKNAIADISMTSDRFTHLLICVDAEDKGHDARLAEIETIVDEAECPVGSTVVVAECCIEAWLLGNRRFIKRNPQDARLRDFLRHYNVIDSDPENIPAHTSHRTRATLCHSYLKAAFRERKVHYTKRNPGEAATEPFFKALCERTTLGLPGKLHLRSFARLLELPERVQLERRK